MMTITWDIDEARAVIRAQMAEANRLDEVIDDLLAETSAAIARAEAAETTLASCNRARQAAEAECERLREQVAQAKVDGANEERSLHWMSESVEVQRLREQVATLEIDHEKLLAMVVDLQDNYSNALKGAYIAEAKVSDLNERVASLSHTNAVMAGDYGECQQEVERLRQKVATLRHAFQFVMNATGNRLSITSMNVATSALEATA